MERRGFLRVAGASAAVAVLGLVGCGPKGLSAEAAKEQCFTNQVHIHQMEGLFYSDSGEYAPIGDVVSKLGVKCPSGGTYSFNQTTGKVSCSVHGVAPGQ